MIPSRRFVLLASVALIPSIARASPSEVAALVHAFAGETRIQDAVLKLDLPVLVENGNAVAMTVSALDPPSPIVEIQVYAESNPLPNVVTFRFGPRSGAPKVSTRIRLATSQTVIALARSRDGAIWRDSVELLVTLAACIE